MFPTDLLQASKNREPGEGWLRAPTDCARFAQETQRGFQFSSSLLRRPQEHKLVEVKCGIFRQTSLIFVFQRP